MTTALYDVKAHLSEYITHAENGEVIEITKHGVATTVLISLKMFNEMMDDYEVKHSPSFVELTRKWREQTGGLTNEEVDEYIKLCESERHDEIINPHREENPWL